VSLVACRACGTEWAATVRPCCPTCLLDRWLASPDLISDKHHPENASEVHPDYRSMVSDELVANLRAVLAEAAMHGTWYYNTEYEKYNHITHLPLQLKPGVGQSAGNARPDRFLEDLVVADADQDPHLFADGHERTRYKLAAGIYRPLPTCARARCDNLSPPRSRRCVVHVDPPLAVLPAVVGRSVRPGARRSANRRDG